MRAEKTTNDTNDNKNFLIYLVYFATAKVGVFGERKKENGRKKSVNHKKARKNCNLLCISHIYLLHLQINTKMNI
jgi:hypothetical protein